MNSSHLTQWNWLGLSLFISLLSCLMIFAPTVELDATIVQTRSDLVNVRVAIIGFHGRQSNNNGSAIALQYMYEWMNASVEVIDGLDVQNGKLFQFDLVIFPAANPNAYYRELTPLGIERIRHFVALGGSILSICRGTEFVVNNLRLADVSLHLCGAQGVVCYDEHHHDGVSEKYLSELIVNHESTGPQLYAEPDSYWLFAIGSSYFNWSARLSILPIMFYANSELPAMIALRYGAGTAFLSSPHPEFEEGDDRDGVTNYDYLNDTDSEWNLLQKISCWLIDASPAAPVEPCIWTFTGISVAVLFTTIYLLFRRRRQKQ
ncbi:MAG: hypothetical protein ACFFCF_09280 [Promethearchaeota archaeon]